MIDIIFNTFFVKKELKCKNAKKCKNSFKVEKRLIKNIVKNPEDRTVLSEYFDHVKGLLA